MKLKIKNADEFRRLLTALLHDLVDARFHFSLNQNLAKATEEYATEFAQSPTFWGLTFTAHIEAVLLRLCRAFDTYNNSALNLRNLLDTIEANLSIFDKPELSTAIEGECLRGIATTESHPRRICPQRPVPFMRSPSSCTQRGDVRMACVEAVDGGRARATALLASGNRADHNFQARSELQVNAAHPFQGRQARD